MKTYTIEETFANESELQEWLKQNLKRHNDGFRRTYKGDIVAYINTIQNAYEEEITLRSIQTWK